MTDTSQKEFESLMSGVRPKDEDPLREIPWIAEGVVKTPSGVFYCDGGERLRTRLMKKPSECKDITIKCPHCYHIHDAKMENGMVTDPAFAPSSLLDDIKGLFGTQTFSAHGLTIHCWKCDAWFTVNKE